MCLLGAPQDKVVGSMRYFASESGTPVQALTANGNARADAMRMVHAGELAFGAGLLAHGDDSGEVAVEFRCQYVGLRRQNGRLTTSMRHEPVRASRRARRGP